MTRLSWHMLRVSPKSGEKLVALFRPDCHGISLEAAGGAGMTPGQSAENIITAMEIFETKRSYSRPTTRWSGSYTASPLHESGETVALQRPI